ncbi:MAG: phosphatidate cytidylyltransferase [Acidimicrobiia bacterium]|nr:phosphatidate cytidylyltransferase [Acidimicrobiia bacterium]
MSGDGPDQAEPRILRPWETEFPRTADDDGDDAAPIPVDESTHAEVDGEAADEEPPSFGDLGSGPTSLDEFTNDDYIAATTREYQGLAEEVARAAEEDVERQAVAASLPGVGSGLIGFDDVTGVKGLSEEEVEAAEQQRASDLTLRVGTAIVLVAIFLGTLLLGQVWFAGFVAIVMLISLSEFYTTVRSRGFSPVALFGFLAVLGGAVGTLRSGPVAIGVSLGVCTAITALFYGAAGRRNPVENVSLTLMGAAWISLLAFAIAITAAPENYEGLILLVVLLTAAFDAGSYFAGRAMGRRLMAPQVSPKKTWEGFVGGVLTAFVLASILSTFKAIFVVDLTQALMTAGMIVVLAPLGDAAESVVKRALDTKDMGSLLPGHGGMLDRIDALLFVVPGAYLLFQYFGLV